MKKSLVMLGALVLALAGVTGCSKAPTEEEYKAWATEHGYVEKPAENGWVNNPAGNGWVLKPLENGYVAAPSALPAPRLDMTLTAGKTKYSNANAGITLYPNDTNKGAKAIDFLGRSDVVYIDAREAQAYQIGHIEGFDWLPFFDLIGNGNATNPLFKYSVDSATGVYTVTPNYQESVDVIKSMIPTDKTLFLMCQGGGRIVHFCAVLEYCGYDMSKVYNIGGWSSEATAKSNGYKVVTAPLTSVTATYNWSSDLTPVAPAE